MLLLHAPLHRTSIPSSKNQLLREFRGAIVNTLKDATDPTNPVLVATTATDSLGDYLFTDFPCRDYVVEETNLPAIPLDVSSIDGGHGREEEMAER